MPNVTNQRKPLPILVTAAQAYELSRLALYFGISREGLVFDGIQLCAQIHGCGRGFAGASEPLFCQDGEGMRQFRREEMACQDPQESVAPPEVPGGDSLEDLRLQFPLWKWVVVRRCLGESGRLRGRRLLLTADLIRGAVRGRVPHLFQQEGGRYVEVRLTSRQLA